MDNEILNSWNCIITRNFKIQRKDMKFLDYTNWISYKHPLASYQRLDTTFWEEYILVKTKAGLTNLITIDNNKITEVVK